MLDIAAFELVEQRLGVGALTSRELYDIKLHSYWAIGCVIEWLRGEIEATPEELAAWESANMPEFLREAYRHPAVAQ